MSVEIRQANDRKTMNDFIAFPRKLYKGSKEYIPDLDSDVRDFFDAKRMTACGMPAFSRS